MQRFLYILLCLLLVACSAREQQEVAAEAPMANGWESDSVATAFRSDSALKSAYRNGVDVASADSVGNGSGNNYGYFSGMGVDAFAAQTHEQLSDFFDLATVLADSTADSAFKAVAHQLFDGLVADGGVLALPVRPCPQVDTLLNRLHVGEQWPAFYGCTPALEDASYQLDSLTVEVPVQQLCASGGPNVRWNFRFQFGWESATGMGGRIDLRIQKLELQPIPEM